MTPAPAALLAPACTPWAWRSRGRVVALVVAATVVTAAAAAAHG